MPNLRRVLAAATLVIATGCAALMPGLFAKSAENPLSGQPVTWSRVAPGLPFEGEKACTLWPIEDSLNVTATDAKICVSGTIHKLVEPPFDGPEEMSLTVESDGSGKTGLGAGQAGDVVARPRKVGSCFNKSTGSDKNVWVADFSGCVPNKSVAGPPVLSKASTYLQVGDARWKFAGQAASAKKADGANPPAH